MKKFFHSILIALIFFNLPVISFPKEDFIYNLSNKQIDKIIKLSRSLYPSTNDSFILFTEKSLGVKYKGDPLGEGEYETYDKDPLYNFKEADCVTFIEQCLALSISKSFKDFLPNLNKIRYKNGKIGILTRNHYSLADWLPNNKWLVQDVTREIGKNYIKNTSRTIDKQKFFKDKGINVDINKIICTTNYIPKDKIKKIKDKLSSGLIIFHVGDIPGIIVLHWGVLIKDQKSDKLFIRHASSIQSKVVDEEFITYLEKYKFIKGLKFIKINNI